MQDQDDDVSSVSACGGKGKGKATEEDFKRWESEAQPLPDAQDGSVQDDDLVQAEEAASLALARSTMTAEELAYNMAVFGPTTSLKSSEPTYGLPFPAPYSRLTLVLCLFK